MGTHEIFQEAEKEYRIMKSLYLLVNLFTILVPFIFSFHPKIRFHKTWASFFPAVMIVAFLFIAWDVFFTRMGVWSFNPAYVTGYYFWNLPIEEVLFFICIPFACVFTYFCLDKFYDLRWKQQREKSFAVFFALFLLAMGIIFRDRWYTAASFISTALVIFLLVFIAKVNWFGKSVTVYAILLLPFFIVNGILTGAGLEEPVVSYNNDENLGLRILTIPVEDSIYGFELFILNLFFFHWFRSKRTRHTSPETMYPAAIAEA